MHLMWFGAERWSGAWFVERRSLSSFITRRLQLHWNNLYLFFHRLIHLVDVKVQYHKSLNCCLYFIHCDSYIRLANLKEHQHRLCVLFFITNMSSAYRRWIKSRSILNSTFLSTVFLNISAKTRRRGLHIATPSIFLCNVSLNIHCTFLVHVDNITLKWKFEKRNNCNLAPIISVLSSMDTLVNKYQTRPYIFDQCSVWIHPQQFEKCLHNDYLIGSNILSNHFACLYCGLLIMDRIRHGGIPDFYHLDRSYSHGSCVTCGLRSYIG